MVQKKYGKNILVTIAKYINTKRLYNEKSKQYILIYKFDVNALIHNQVASHSFMSRSQSSYQEHKASFRSPSHLISLYSLPHSFSPAALI